MLLMNWAPSGRCIALLNGRAVPLFCEVCMITGRWVVLGCLCITHSQGWTMPNPNNKDGAKNTVANKRKKHDHTKQEHILGWPKGRKKKRKKEEKSVLWPGIGVRPIGLKNYAFPGIFVESK